MPETALLPAEPQDELRALGRFAFDELAGFPRWIGDVHHGVAQRVFWALGPLGRPAEAVHGGVTRGVYGALSGSVRALGRTADAALERGGAGERTRVSATRAGATAIAALDGLLGDRFEREGSALHQPLAVRIGGHPVPLEPEAVRDAFPAATPWPVVFVHGLAETEFSWSLGAGPDGETYGERLARDLGCTPVFVRYNTGRHISENGRSLAEAMEALVAAWPVEVQQLALVGHSMGGLVARSACHQAAAAGHGWTGRVRHVVSLGTPHMGAPLEQAAHAASALLYRLPDTRAWGAVLRRRSAGIRDLRAGSLVDEDWLDRDPEALRQAACQEVPLLDGATHCFISASVTRSARHPLGRLLGDCLVLVPSASGRSRSRRIPFKDEHGAHLGGLTHFALLNHPQVYERLAAWLATPPEQLTA